MLYQNKGGENEKKWKGSRRNTYGRDGKKKKYEVRGDGGRRKRNEKHKQ